MNNKYPIIEFLLKKDNHIKAKLIEPKVEALMGQSHLPPLKSKEKLIGSYFFHNKYSS